MERAWHSRGTTRFFCIAFFLALTACSNAIPSVDQSSSSNGSTSPVTSAGTSSVLASPTSVPADGSSQSIITVVLRDSDSNPIVGHSVALYTDRGAFDSYSYSTNISDTAGQVSFTVTSATAGTSTYSAEDQTNSVTISQTASVTYSVLPISPTLSTVDASTSSLTADGSSTSTITVTLLDTLSNPVVGKTVALTSSRGAIDTISTLSAVTDSFGIATFTVSSTTAGSAIIAATVPADSLAISQTTTLTFNAGATSASVSTLSASPSNVLANGTSTSTITVTLRDAFSNVVSGKTVVLSSIRGAADTIAPASSTTDSSGLATFTVKSSTAGFAILLANNTSESIAIIQTATIDFYQSLVLAPSSTSVASNGVAIFSYTGGIGPYSYSILSGGGSISSSGLYTAGATAGSATVRLTDTSTGMTSNASITINDPADYTIISSGSGFNCAITSTGILKCWGANISGQLGIGTTTDKYTPQVVDTGVTYQTVSTGTSHTCAITLSGVLKCWGNNINGQLGNGSTTQSSSPVVIDSGTSYAKVSAGDASTCAVTTSGVLKCWGKNANGQVGDGTTTTPRTSPLVVDSGVSYSSVAVGGMHACGLTASSALKCWGMGDEGQRGDGSNVDSTTPVQIGTGYISVSAGYKHSCAINSSNSLYCWGSQWAGNYNGSGTQTVVPTIIDGGTTYASVSAGNGFTGQTVAGANHTCAVTTGGSLKCWGSTFNGELGTGVQTSGTSDPALVGTGYQAASAGFRHTCSIVSNKIKCWGENTTGQLGLNWASIMKTPMSMDGSTTYKFVSAESSHTCAITSSDSLSCWGQNGSGQLGIGSLINQGTPTPVDSGTSYQTISLGSSFTCGITTSGVLKCWGANFSGQLGIGSTTTKTSPQVVDSGTSYQAISTGSSHTCGITTTGVLKCWGNNSSKQLGNNSTTQSNSPIVIDSGVTYKSISAGYSYTCGVTTANVLKCWGVNSSNQLGDGTTTTAGLPIVIDAGVAYDKVFAGGFRACGILTTGFVKCWGSNSSGGLGDGTGTNRTTPVAIDATTKYISIAHAGSSGTTCGITDTSTLKCWGYNFHGQVGNNTTTTTLSPVVIDAGTGYASVSTKQYPHTFGVTTNGILKTWGDITTSGLSINLYVPSSPVQ